MSLSVTHLRQRVQACKAADFPALALDVFALQREYNPVYAEYLGLIGKTNWQPISWTEIPCLPISLFITHDLRTGVWQPQTTFRSSGTTGSETSKMPVRDLAAYQELARRTFETLVGDLNHYRLLALLPNYLEREDSGLVAMIEDFMSASADGSGYFLDDFAALEETITRSRREGQPVLLWGVTFALLQLAEREADLVLPKGSCIMETGGMKGRGPELTRKLLHKKLAARFGCPIWSEYGMTELSSQAYRPPAAGFLPANTLRIQARELNDPFQILAPGAQGALNLYDLANVDTCAFVASEDLGRSYADGSFEVLGRVDRSVVRGCNLLVL